MASSAYPSLFSEKITKEIGGASSLIGNREARTKSIFKKYGNKSAYFFRTFAYFFGPSPDSGGRACGVRRTSLIFFFTPRIVQPLRDFFRRKKIQKSSFSWLFLFISKRTPIYEYAIRALAL